ncbi:MAG TPA: IclR family transcriptional regulator [Solirubrobacteraceae bacterium]|nr:IclR family transcriptional regulator [Solirubrobacteraceae bacterium]
MSQTAGRALDLLEHIAWSEESLALAELTVAVGIDKTTASRLLKFLQDRMLITRDPRSKRYSVGPRLLGLSAAAMHRFDFLSLVMPILGQLRDETGETASVHVRVGNERICLAGQESLQPVRRVLPLGQATRLWVGPASKVILAFAADSRELMAEAAAAGSDVVHLESQLEAIRRDGEMIGVGDRTPGVGAIAVPLHRANGAFGSVSVAGPAERWTPDRMREFAARIHTSAREIAGILGARQW